MYIFSAYTVVSVAGDNTRDRSQTSYRYILIFIKFCSSMVISHSHYQPASQAGLRNPFLAKDFRELAKEKDFCEPPSPDVLK